MTTQLLIWPVAAAPSRRRVPGRPLRPLPRTVVPYQDETLTSYQRRLAAANHLDVYHHVRVHLDEHNASMADPGDLAALTGQPVTALLYALPELREHAGQDAAAGGDLLIGGHLILTGRTRLTRDVVQQRPACRRCTSSRGITGEVVRWVRHDQNVCLRHQLWIGPHVIAPHEQAHLDAVPDIVRAQRRHDHLIRRRGQAATHAAFRDATTITQHYLKHRPEVIRSRTATLTSRDSDPGPNQDDRWLPLISHPQTVALTGVLAAPRWRQAAASDARDSTAPPSLRIEIERSAGLGSPCRCPDRDPLDAWWRAQRQHTGHRQSLQRLDSYARTVSLERW